MPLLPMNHGTCTTTTWLFGVAHLLRRAKGRARVFEGRFLGLAQQPVWAGALDPARDPANDLELLEHAGVVS